LYGASHDQFVAERKRLSTELKSTGDKAGAAQLAKLPRPSVSVWAVNQLWRRERDAFEALLSAAERVRAGDLAAAGPHRDALAKLRALAADLLHEAGHAAQEATLRRVGTTLAALAANGGFAPDPPGALRADRDPPGFETAGFAETVEASSSSQSRAASARQDAMERAERRKRELEQARREAERQRLQNELQAAERATSARASELERAKKELARAEAAYTEVLTAKGELAARIAALTE
jgi:hypothetical protein